MLLPSLPRNARLPIKRSNQPAAILGSLTNQRHPVALKLDGDGQSASFEFTAPLMPARKPSSRKTNSRAPAEPRLSRLRRPGDLAVDEWQIKLRRQFGL